MPLGVALGACALALLVGVLLGAWWQRRTIPPAAGAVMLADRGRPSSDRLADGVRDALRDGDLSDDELERLAPGATVVSNEDGVTVTEQTTTFQVRGPDGSTYERIDDIPDPVVREQVRRMLDG